MQNSTPALSGFATALHAAGPAPDRAEHLSLYGQFVGDWTSRVVIHAPDGTRAEGEGEIHFGWVLEGRAIQDVWTILRRADRRTDLPLLPGGNWYGTTLRLYDPQLEAWRIYWLDPATNSYRQQIGRRRGADIVQEGTTESGRLTRWSFTAITSASFHWKGEGSIDQGASWHLATEVFARRV